MAGGLWIGHSHWRWLVLAMVAVAFVKMAIGLARGGAWSDADRYTLLAARIVVYVQVAMGLVLVGVMRETIDHAALGPHMGAALLGVGMLEMGAARARKAEEDAARYKIATIGSAGALVLFLVAVYINTN